MIGRRYIREGLFRCGAYQKGRVIRERGYQERGSLDREVCGDVYV